MRSNKNIHQAVSPSNEGYTIVESMIFLAVTGAILVSAMLLIGGQQRKSEFNTGIRDIHSQLTDIVNDVSTGYYNNPTTGLTCPYTSRVSTELGGNADCVFVAKAIQFASQENGDESAEVYSLIGRRQKPDRTDIRSLRDAEPVILNEADTTLRLPYGIRVVSVTYTAGGTNYPVGSVGLSSKFTGNLGSGGIEGTQNIDLIPITGTTLGQSKADNASKTAIEQNIMDESFYNPDGGVTICFRSGGTNQFAKIKLGGQGRQNSVSLEITGSC
jgi:hypothetical protein